MALQKSYTVKIYDNDGTTIVRTIPQGNGGLKNLPTFRSTINAGLGECVLDFDLPFDDFNEGTDITFMNIIDIYVMDADNPRGRRIYRGFVSKYEPYIEDGGNEGVRVTCLGLVSLLATSYYKNGTNFTVSHSAVDPQTIFQAIITHFNTIYGGSLLSYSGVTSTVGTTVSMDFTDQKWSDAIKKTMELAGTNWWWKCDADGLCHFKAKPGTATHTFTIGKDIQSLICPKDSEKIVNDVQVRRSGGTVSDYSDATSQAEFGTGSSASGKRTKIISDTSLTDAAAANQRGNKEINDNKDEKIKATLVINTNYDLESIKVGQTCKVRNHRKGNTFFNANMMIVSVFYQGDTCQVELEEQPADFGRELSSLISSTAAASSGSSSGSSPGFVDRETPSGSVNGSNVTFTLSQTPVSGSEHFYINGVLQNVGASNDYTISSSTITCNTAPASGSILLVSYRTSSGTTNFVDREVPSGTINGSNVTFTLAHTPTTGSLHLYLNGILQNEGASNDWTLSGTTITFSTAPASGSTLVVSYRY